MYPDIVAAYIQLLLALFVIYNGIVNIANVLNLNDELSKYTDTFIRRYNKISKRKTENEEKKKRKEKFKEIDDSINQGLEEQKKKLISPLKGIVNKVSEHSTLYIVRSFSNISYYWVVYRQPPV